MQKVPLDVLGDWFWDLSGMVEGWNLVRFSQGVLDGFSEYLAWIGGLQTET